MWGTILGRNPYSAWFFNGLIDEVKVYDRVLSDSEVLENYQSVLLQKPACQTSCYWKVGDKVTGGNEEIIVDSETIVQAKADCLKDSGGNILADGTQVSFIVYEDDPLGGDKNGESTSTTQGGISTLDVKAQYIGKENILDIGDNDENEFYFEVKDSNGGLLCNSGDSNSNLLYVNKPIIGKCKTQSDCPEGQTCESGSCVTLAKPECKLNTDCASDKQCVGNKCVPIIPTQQCTPECESNEICVEGTCQLQETEIPDQETPDEEIPSGRTGGETPKPKSETATFTPLAGTKELVFPVPKKYIIQKGSRDLSLLESIDIYPAYEIGGQNKYCDTPYTYNIE